MADAAGGEDSAIPIVIDVASQAPYAGELLSVTIAGVPEGALGFAFTEQELIDFAPVRQRLVRTHRKTGRKSLYLSSHAGRIVGWPVPEAQMLLRELTEHATQREFVYAHKWRAGDLVVWDNRTTMHRARPFDDAKYPRDLRRTTLTDGVPTIDQSLPTAAE